MPTTTPFRRAGRASAALLAIVSLCAIARPCRAQDAGGKGARLDHLREQFQWAEYDSVIAMGEPLAHDPSLKPADAAAASLFLGVAYYAKGRVLESADQFMLSHRLDSALTLDPLYASKEILDHYRFTLESEQALESYRHAGEDQKRAVFKSRMAWDLSLAGAAFAVAGAGGGLSYYEWVRGESAAADLNRAATVTKDPKGYASARSAVRSADAWTLGYAGAGAVGLAGAGYFVIAYALDKKSLRRTEAAHPVTWMLPKQGEGLIAAWGF